jgi:nicotinate phosphoribosyltransferase
MNGVYKLTAIKIPDKAGYRTEYKVKTSPGKRTYPGPKQVFRCLENGRIKTDVIGLEDEPASADSTALLKKYMENGRVIRKQPTLAEIQQFHREQLRLLPQEFLELDASVQDYPVRFSGRLETLASSFNR